MAQCEVRTLPHASLPEEVPPRMVDMYVDQFMLNSAAYVFYHGGFFHASVNNTQIPSYFPVHLTTDCTCPHPESP